MKDQRRIELAGRLARFLPTEPRKKGTGYYLMNVGNPVVDKLLQEFRDERMIHRRYPMGDALRYQFELSLLNEEALDEIEAFCERHEKTASSPTDQSEDQAV